MYHYMFVDNEKLSMLIPWILVAMDVMAIYYISLPLTMSASANSSHKAGKAYIQ